MSSQNHTMNNSQARRDFERSREFYAGLTRLMRSILEAHEANTQRFLASQANEGFGQPDSQNASSATQQSPHPEPPIVAPNAEGRAHSPAQDPPLPVPAPDEGDATRTSETQPPPRGRRSEHARLEERSLSHLADASHECCWRFRRDCPNLAEGGVGR